MSNTNPTIVQASLDDKELQASINKMVANFDKGLQTMLEHSNEYVGKIQTSLQKIGDTNFGAKGSNDGAVVKQTKAQNDFTDAVKRSTNEIKRQGKEGEMSFDQIAAALSKARQTVSEFNTKRASGILPSSEDYKRYEQALARIVEYNDKLKQSALSRADANQWANVFDAKRVISDMSAVDDRYKKLTRWYTVLEKEDQRRIASEEKANQKRLADLEKEKAAQDKVIKSYQDSVLKAEFGKVMKMPTSNIDEIRAKFERLSTIIANIRELGILSPEKISAADSEVKKLGASIQRYEKFEQERIAAEQKFIIEQAKEVEQTQTLEGRVKGLAQAAREYMKANSDNRWSSSAYGKDLTIYAEGDVRARGLSIEEQIRRQLEAEQQVIQQQVSTAQQLNNERKKYVSPTINDDAYQITRNAIARKLGIDTSKVINADAQYDSIKRVGDALKQLQDAYARMTNEERNSPIGKQMIRQMQELERQTQQLRKQMSRPISLKDALGGSEKTLDDIAYKMQRLRAYKQGIDLTKPNATNEIKQVDEALAKLQKDADKWMGKSQQMIASNTALGRSWNYMKNRLAFYFTVGASTSFIKNLIEVRSQYEMNERALGILINSAERGTQIFNELSQMALVSPYTLIELSSAAKQLTAYDIAAKDVVNTTRRLADMAAAVGIPIERLTYALGQIKAYGYLNARDARMFANAGIPLVKNLSEYYTELEGRLVSTADIYDRIKKKQIGYEEVMSTISKMTDEGGKFFDFQAKMAETLKVQLANLTLAWNNMLNDMGEESQGVIVGGIGALKQMFLHWKDIEHVLYELVVALGAYKAYQIITTRLMGTTAASLDAQVLAMKRNNAAMLEKQALTRKLTVDELRQVSAQNQVTAADYRNALSGKQLTKQKALLLAAIYKNNVQLKAALVNMGLLTTAEATSITRGKALAIVFKSIGISIRNAALAIKSFMMSNWLMFAIAGVYELIHAYTSANEHIEEINKQATEHAKEAFENIKQYLESESTINTRQRVVYKEGNPLTDAESQKAWDEMREKIELSSSASNTFIAKLMQINDINERLAAGFDYLEDVQKVAGVMQTLEDDAIDVSSTTLGGLFGEGLKDDLEDFINAYQKYVSLNENLRQSGVGEEYFNEQKRALEEFRGEVEKTTTSLYNIASKEGFNTNEQREFFEREISEIAQAEQMGAKETRIFRMQAEEEYYAYARAQLMAQLEYQQGAQKAATEARIKDLDNEFGTNKALQESFFTWLTEKQDHAVKNMLRGKTQEEIKQGEWLKGSNAKWVEEMARKFSKEYGVSFDGLRKLVMDANTWHINIPVFFQTIGQPLTDVQRDYEARTGKKFSSNPLIKDAKSQVEIIDILKKKQKEVANEMETARKAGDKYWENNKERYKKENDALVADIHAYNALTDAEEKANKKSGKGGSKKDPLLDALKQEINLVEKLQSDYDKLSKSGASQADALDTIRGAYGKTIRLLNAQLQSYGLPQIDISQLITGKDPNKALAHFKQTLDTLVNKGMLTLERSKELEAVVEKFTLSAKTYNLDMITKGLNNELGKLKDEYELAVELDANPEMGNLFADWMGINTNELPRTFQEVVRKAQQGIDKVFAENNRTDKIDIASMLNKESFDKWVKDSGLAIDSELVKAVEQFRQYLHKTQVDENKKMTDEWSKLVEKYGDLQAKILKIYKDSLREQIGIVRKFGDSGEVQEALDLSKKINLSQDPAEIARLQEQLANIIKSVVARNPQALDIAIAVENKGKSETAKAAWEDFKKDDLYTMTFEDMANNSTRAIQLIIDKLNGLKDKVKEDPASMKALMKSLEDAEKELNTRDPFGEIARSLRDMSAASQETKAAQEALWRAEVDVEQAQQKVKDSEGGSPEEQKAAQDALAQAVERRTNAQIKLTQAENKGKKAQENLKNSLQGMTQQLGNIQNFFGIVSSLFRAGGDDETADAIDAINEGFTVMTQVIMGVMAAMVILESSNPWLLAIAAALSVIVGLVSFLIGNDDKKIVEQIKDSERAVKRLENTYKNLSHTAEEAYGAMVSGAKKAMQSNKELQLVELKRQLALEKSRDSKHRDEDKIADLEGQIIDLKNEIHDATQDIINDLLDISSAGDGIESLVSVMIDAFRNGEDAMEAFGKEWDKMIDNMILKLIVTQFMKQAWDTVMDNLKKKQEEFLNNPSQAVADAQKEVDRLSAMSDAEIAAEIARKNGTYDIWGWLNRGIVGIGVTNNMIENYKKAAQDALTTATEVLNGQSLDYTKWSLDYMNHEGRDYMTQYAEMLKNSLGDWYTYGENNTKELSALQAGIKGITEEQASALEAYWNSNTQQQFLQSDLLTQIRDAVVGFDIDVQTASLSQILLQLQTNYVVMQSMQSMMEGWTTPSGQGIRVELIS